MSLFDIDLDKLTESEKKIADYILKNIDNIPSLTINELAVEFNVSIATISRFWIKIGYKNFKEVKDQIKNDRKVTPSSKMKNILGEVTDQDITDKIITQQIDYLQKTSENLNRVNLHKAVESIISARNIYIFGSGPSECLSEHLRFRLNRFGINAFKMPVSGREIYEYLVHAKTDDIVIIFGFIRALPEIKVILENAKIEGYTTILFTDLMVSEMLEQADIVLYSCRGEVWDFHSMVGPMAVIDCLAVGIAAVNEKGNLQKLDNLSMLRKRYYNHIPR